MGNIVLGNGHGPSGPPQVSIYCKAVFSYCIVPTQPGVQVLTPWNVLFNWIMEQVGVGVVVLTQLMTVSLDQNLDFLMLCLPSMTFSTHIRQRIGQNFCKINEMCRKYSTCMIFISCFMQFLIFVVRKYFAACLSKQRYGHLACKLTNTNSFSLFVDIYTSIRQLCTFLLLALLCTRTRL